MNLHNLAVYFAVVLVLKPSVLGFTALLSIPGLVLILINGVWVSDITHIPVGDATLDGSEAFFNRRSNVACINLRRGR